MLICPVKPVLNDFAELPGDVRTHFRREIQALIQNPESALYDREVQSGIVYLREKVTLHVPMRVGGFTDFMCLYEHVNVVST